MKRITTSDNYYFFKQIQDHSGRWFKIYRPTIDVGKYIIEWKTDREEGSIEYVSVLIQFSSPVLTDDAYTILNIYRNGRNYKAPSMTNKYRLPINAIINEVRS